MHARRILLPGQAPTLTAGANAGSVSRVTYEIQ